MIKKLSRARSMEAQQATHTKLRKRTVKYPTKDMHFRSVSQNQRWKINPKVAIRLQSGAHEDKT
jgi:hypothetical protein